MPSRATDEGIEEANNCAYDLAAGAWTDEGAKILDTTKRLRAGVIWANTFNKSGPASSFGAYKGSGFGLDAGVHGLEGG